ncbi:NAD(P)/FAD-dependent oxidoreductase [Clostridium tyrobutyricum]|uniref:NAD(P)/FAD-dependent oxidoreductase n=1 Tax=Clostridium tyrobutyricum TaxID=1519 RepID=UPI001C38C26D|nr:NAD(P)/FAD-dependent oxidoreductase [Clostridium tyrobutyricum]MBV4432522.1 NAD(P)/FAD-dependent oxidoreductase [Clostridium tyrobutyricum]
MFHDIIIIGAGASGLMAAITAKNIGKDAAVLEGNHRIGTKILTTGNGRCNITNTNISLDRYHSTNKYFFKDVLNKFTYKDTIDFFSALGLPLTKLEDGRMYPLSLQASSVLDILKMSIDDRQIPVYLDCKVKDIIKENQNFNIICNNKTFKCKKIIICTGGKSAAYTGSDGSGFLLSQKLGHSIILPTPSLVQLKLKHNRLKALSGIKFNGTCEIFVDKKSMRKEYGEILFTDYGISGPPILQVSGIASRNLINKKEVSLNIDLFPKLNEKHLIEFFENHWGLLNYRSIHDSFIGIINKKLIPIILKEASIDNIHKPVFQLNWKEKIKIIHILKSWKFSVYDTNSFRNSQVTSGGVNTLEVDSKTLESIKIKNLYFAGEVLDVDGDCGGFNLQWCWSSGFISAKSAAGN